MERDEIKELVQEELAQSNSISVQEAVKITVKEVFLTMGMDASDPLELQQDFHFIRELRENTESFKGKVMQVVVGMCVTALLLAVWYGIRAALNS
jgi:hypothetical protein